jgi:hypothetical protein
MTVSAAPIVEDLDIIENISAGKISCFVDAFADTFFFQAAEEGFGYCIIPTISASAHAGQQAMRTAEADPIVTAILAALIGAMLETCV